MFKFLFGNREKEKPKSSPCVKQLITVTQFNGNILDDDLDDFSEVSKSFEKDKNELNALLGAVSEAKEAYPDFGEIKPNQDSILKRLLKESVDLAKNQDTLPQAIDVLQKAFERDQKVKQLTLYHYKRMSNYLYKLKRFDEGYSWAARLTMGIPGQQPSDTANWVDFYADVLELLAERLISEPRLKSQCNSLGEAVNAISQRYQAALKRKDEAKSLRLYEFIQHDEISKYLSLSKHKSRVPMIEPYEWHQAIQSAHSNYLPIYWDLRNSDQVIADLRNPLSDQWKVLRKIMKKLKQQDLADAFIADLAATMRGDWKSDFVDVSKKYITRVFKDKKVDLDLSFFENVTK